MVRAGFCCPHTSTAHGPWQARGWVGRSTAPFRASFPRPGRSLRPAGHFGGAGSVAGLSGDSPPPQRSTHRSLIGSWWCRDPCATNAVGYGPEGSAGPWALVAPRLLSFGGAAVGDAAPHLRAMAIRPRPGLESVGQGVRPEPTMTRAAQKKRPTDCRRPDASCRARSTPRRVLDHALVTVAVLLQPVGRGRATGQGRVAGLCSSTNGRLARPDEPPGRR